MLLKRQDIFISMSTCSSCLVIDCLLLLVVYGLILLDILKFNIRVTIQLFI